MFVMSYFLLNIWHYYISFSCSLLSYRPFILTCLLALSSVLSTRAFAEHLHQASTVLPYPLCVLTCKLLLEHNVPEHNPLTEVARNISLTEVLRGILHEPPDSERSGTR